MADGTIGLVLSRLAIVTFVERSINAHTTVVAVLKVFGASDPAESAVGTVVGSFRGGHPQITDIAVIFSELDAAADAVVAVE